MIELIHGDSYKVLPYLDLPQYNKIALVTDPPYIVQSGGSTRQYFKGIHAADIANGFDFSILCPDNLIFQNIICFCSKPQRYELERFIRGIVHLEGNAETAKIVTTYHRTELLFWDKLNPAPHANKCYPTDKEFWLHAWRKGFHPIGSFADKRTHITHKSGGKSGYEHATVKPLEVMTKAMKTLDADLIIDPFMGTGTTGVVAKNMGIDFIGIEIDRTFFEIANKRLHNSLDGQLPL